MSALGVSDIQLTMTAFRSHATSGPPNHGGGTFKILDSKFLTLVTFRLGILLGVPQVCGHLKKRLP